MFMKIVPKREGFVLQMKYFKVSKKFFKQKLLEQETIFMAQIISIERL